MVFSALCYLLFHPGVTQAIIGGAPDAVSRNGVVKIQSQRWSCTGTLISRTLVLTAAHCVWDPQSQSYFYDLTSAVVGTEDGIAGRSSGISKVIGAVRHPGYNGTDGRNDIALIQVQDVFDGNFIELATAEETAASEQAFSIGIASGFGVTQQGGSSSSTLLQVNQQILSSTYCRSSWNYKITYADTFLCALGAPTSTVCSGDSGGPLFLNIGGRRKLAGVTNFGTQSCGAGVSVFARVSSFQSFLVENGFAALARTTPALPALPPPSVIQSLPQLPSRPVFQTDPSKQVTLPKFSVSRIFQLILQGSTKCSIYIDGPIALRGSQIRVYVGNKSRSPIKRIVLDEFGDVFIATKMNCLSIRGLGVFILQPNSTVKVRTEE
jgi:Trypsin